jgi:amino acid transporter
VIVGAMVAVSFGGSATSLFVGVQAGRGWDNLCVTVLILGMLAINLVGATFVAKTQSLIVAGVLAVFAVFMVVPIVNINTGLLAFSTSPSLSKILASVALTFFAYLGFNVITFTAGDLREPAHDLPRAITLALGITSLVSRSWRSRRCYRLLVARTPLSMPRVT